MSDVWSVERQDIVSKVPAATLAFWLVKICATTVGETGADALSMTLKLGYAVTTAIFLALFLIAIGCQISVRRYHPFLYWSVAVATTTVGTTTSDFIDRTLHFGHIRSSVVLQPSSSPCCWRGAWRLDASLPTR